MDLFNKHRPGDINIECGVANTEGEMTYYSFEEAALNSFDKKLSEERIEQKWKLKEKIQVKINTINRLLEENLPRNTKIDFINMDIEGFELSVLENFNFEKYAPDYFLIEELSFCDKDFSNYSTPIYSLLKEKNYKPVAKTRKSVLYKKYK